jgi:iron-sulfur cluster assembly accessory protein
VLVITLTDTAASKVKELLDAEGEPELALRVAVRPGGCSGYSYEMFFDGDIAGDDELAEFSGVKVIVDPSSAQLLMGATLDYKDGLQNAGFAIDNPNATRSCGCGQSFSSDGSRAAVRRRVRRLPWPGRRRSRLGRTRSRADPRPSRSRP